MAKAAKKTEAFDPDKFLSETESFNPDKFLADTAPESSALEAAGTSWANANLLGYLPEASALAEKAITPVYEAVTQSKVPESTYEENKKYYENLAAKQAQEHPTASGVGTLAGILTPMPGNLIGKAASKAGEVVKGAGLGAKIARGAIEGATGGALYGGLSNPGEEGSRLEGAATGATFGGAVGGALPAAAEGVKSALSGASNLAKSAFKKALSTLGGTSVPNIEAYMANPKAIDEAKTVEDVKMLIDEATGKISKAVENAQLTKDEAKDALKAVTTQIKDAAQTKKLDVNEKLRSSQSALNEALKLKKEEINSARLPKGLQNDVGDAINELKRIVSQGSDESYKILEKSNTPIDLSGVREEIVNQRKDLLTNGKLFGDSAKQADAKLAEIADLVNSLPKDATNVDPSTVKKIIQRIDKDTNYGAKLGEFGDETTNALKSVRRAFDASIKTNIPEYASKMQEVAPQTELLSQVSKKFGTPEKILSKLSSIDKPNLEIERGLLQQLSQTTGKDLVTPIENLSKLKAMGQGPAAERALKRSLPEFEDYRKALIESRGMRPDVLKKAQAEMISQLPETAALTQAEQGLAQAQAKQAPVKSITPQSSENMIKSIMGDRSIEARKAMNELSKLSDTDFVKMIENTGVKAAFEKGAMQGSRNVNLWTIIGAAAAGGAGGYATAGPEGAVAGAVLGATVDRYGPAMTKQILKAVSNVNGLPTVQKIRQMSLPPEVQDDLIRQLRDVVIRGREIKNLPTPVHPDMMNETAQDIKDSKMNSIDKAKNLNSLNRQGVILNPIKIMDDGASSVQDLAKQKARGK